MPAEVETLGVPGSPEDRRRYSDKELALILKLAVELDRGAGGGAGHSLAEIQQIAAEAGIDPDRVAQAAASLEAQRGSGASALLGAPTTFRYQRFVEGEVPESELGELVRAIRRFTGREGQVSQVLDSLEWSQESFEGAATHVAISPRRGRTRVEVTGRYVNNASWLYTGAAIAAAVGSVVAGTEIQAALGLELGVIAAIWGSAYLAARTLWRRIARGGERRTQELSERLSRQISEAQLPRSTPLGPPDSASRG